MQEKKVIIKFNQASCLRCKKCFSPNEEIILLKKSRMFHKKCFDILKKMIKEDV